MLLSEQEKFLACPVQIRTATPCSLESRPQIIQEARVVIELNEARTRLERHEQIMERTSVVLSEVHAQTRAHLNRTAIHGA